jgi:hypothetical protein
MSYRANVTDKQQNVLEAAAFENGIPVHDNGEVKVIVTGAEGGTERVAHSPVANHIGSNAGVVMPIGDVPGRFVETQQGKA